MSSTVKSLLLGEESLPILTKPFWIVGSWMLVTALGLIFLGFKNFQLPDYNPEKPHRNEIETGDFKEDSPEVIKNKKRENIICWLTGLLIFFEVSLEMVFHSFTYTYGLCGPVKMTPVDAGWLNSIFFMTFTLGRLCSIPLSTILSPGMILFCANLGTLLCIGILIIFENLFTYYVTFGVAGFFVCFCFGSTITWLTNNTPSMKSRPMSFIFMGASLAGCISPPLASYAFDQKPIFVYYLCMIYVSITLALLLLLTFIARGAQKSKTAENAAKTCK